MMSLRGHQQPSSTSARYDNRSDQATETVGMYQARNTLGSIGTPTGNLRISTSGATGSTDNSSSYSGRAQSYGLSGGDQPVTINNTGLKSNSANMSASANPNLSHNFDTPRRAQTFGRQPEELHIPSNYTAMGQQNSRDQSHPGSYQSYVDSVSGATPQSIQQSSTSTGQPLPGALQPGTSMRPGPSSANTAPSTIPTLPHISTQTQPYPNTSRSSTASHSHSYSRSSPAGLDQQKYVPYINTPEDSKFASPPSNRYTSTQTPQASASYSPLGLADIRPRVDSGLYDGPPSATPHSSESDNANPTKCNYLAPWAVYAFDWCKWPVQQNGLGDSAGKMAIGSYLEDGHNFVRSDYNYIDRISDLKFLLTLKLDTNFGNSDCTRSRRRLNTWSSTIWVRFC